MLYNKAFVINYRSFWFYDKKVDFIITNSDNSIEAYIELKGTDVRGALKQIGETFQEYKQHNSSNKCYAYVVSSGSRIPKNSSSLTNEIDKLAKMLKRKPIIATSQIEISYSLERHEFIKM